MSASDITSVTQFGGPEGNEYTAPNGRVYTMSDEAGRTEARTPKGKSVGRMAHNGPYTSEPEQQIIGNIEVSSQHRGKGVATALLDYARIGNPDLHHSKTLTEHGKRFAAASPRDWQPKLPLIPDQVTAGGLDMNGPNGGQRGPSPWSSYRDFGPMNRLSNRRFDYQLRNRNKPEPPSQGEQGRLF